MHPGKEAAELKKRIAVAALCALLFVLLLPTSPASADDRLSFLAVNDYLPPELINAAATYGGVTYVPSTIFSNYSLGVYYSYFPSNSTAYVYNESGQLFFEVATGRTYDGNDNEYNAPAILWGGAVYLPLDFLANYFGRFTYRVIGSNAYGSILRIKNGDEVLTDEEFFRAAESLMRRYYANRQALVTPTPSVMPRHTPTPSAPATPAPTEKPSRKGDTVALGLDGLPSADALELLRLQGVQACFFLSAEEIRSSPDTVREIACTGHRLGVSGEDAAACEEAALLLWETARVRTVMAALPPGTAGAERFALFPSARTPTNAKDTALAVTSKLETTKGDQLILFPIDGEDITALHTLLFYIADLEFDVAAIRATDSGKTPIIP